MNVVCNETVDMTFIRPLHVNKGQGHSFWYQSMWYATSYSCQ